MAPVGFSAATRWRQARLLGPAVLVAALSLAVACGPPSERDGGEAGETPSDSAALAEADQILSELPGGQFARLTMQQRLRSVASLGTGLPPTNIERSDLPEPKSTGAGLLEVYCVQCHWLPTPQMHSSEEWEILVRRMILRAQLLEKRADGPHIPDFLTGSVQFRLIPTPEHRDSLQAYLKRNALPVVDPTELPDTEAADLFVERCSACHQTPSPGAHTASGWKPVIARMQGNMSRMGVEQLSDAERSRILGFLEEHAAGTE